MGRSGEMKRKGEVKKIYHNLKKKRNNFSYTAFLSCFSLTQSTQIFLSLLSHFPTFMLFCIMCSLLRFLTPMSLPIPPKLFVEQMDLISQTAPEMWIVIPSLCFQWTSSITPGESTTITVADQYQSVYSVNSHHKLLKWAILRIY